MEEIEQIIKARVSSNEKCFLYFYNCKVHEAICAKGKGIMIEIDKEQAHQLEMDLFYQYFYNEKSKVKGDNNDVS